MKLRSILNNPGERIYIFWSPSLSDQMAVKFYVYSFKSTLESLHNSDFQTKFATFIDFAEIFLVLIA